MIVAFFSILDTRLMSKTLTVEELRKQSSGYPRYYMTYAALA